MSVLYFTIKENFEIIPYLLTILPVIKNKNVKKKGKIWSFQPRWRHS